MWTTRMPTSSTALPHLRRHHLPALSGVALAITFTRKLMNTDQHRLRRSLAAIPAIRDKSNRRAVLDWIQVMPFKLRWQKWGTLVPLGYNSNGPEWFVIKTTQKSFQRKEEHLFSTSSLSDFSPHFIKIVVQVSRGGSRQFSFYSVGIRSVCQTVVRMVVLEHWRYIVQ